MKWFKNRGKTATDVGTLAVTLPGRQARLPLTVAQVTRLMQTAEAARVPAQIVLTVAKRDVSAIVWRLLKLPMPDTQAVRLRLPASVIRDFIDNATGSERVRAVTCGELLDGWPMQQVALVSPATTRRLA